MALERIEAAKRPLVAGDCELEPVRAWIVAADGEARSFEALGAAVARLRLLRRGGGGLLGRLLTAGEGERGSEDEAKANSRRR
jgi:hypothetical protein